jgi:hypothetical protein
MENNNKKKLKKQKTFFTDRFPYIILILIIGISLVIFFIVKDRLPLNFFSKKTTAIESQSSFDLYFASPTKNQSFELVSANETVPIEIKGKNIESNVNYNVNIFINNELIKTLTNSPFAYNWNPKQTGAYDIYAEITDKNNKVLYTSEKISFSVDIKGENSTGSTSPVNVNIEEKKNKILEKTSYRSQNASPIFALKCYKPPVIDGSNDEWGIFDKFSSFTPTILKENYTNANDVSGVFSSCWDADNFYFFIKVIDDVYNQPYNTNQINKGDSVVFVLDTELEKDFNIPFLNNDDYQMEFSAGNNSGSGPESFVRWPSNAPLKGAVLASKKGSGGYTIEGSIPWYSTPTLAPADEIVMGFTVSIFDTDNMESTELVVSSSKQFDLNNVSSLGTLILIDGGDLSLLDQSSSTTDTTKSK